MNLQKQYDRNEFLAFLKEFLPDCTIDIRRVMASGLQATKEVSYLGQCSLLDLQVFEITHLSSSDARVALATDGFKVMKDSATYRALVAYRLANSDSWRLSLMTATPVADEKGKVKQALSNPRRFSFSLGPDAKTHTPEESLINQGRVKDFEDLKNRFSIEVVNKEFYTKIAVLFTQLAGGKREIGRKSIDAGSGSLKLPSTNDDTLHKEFAVRLIGRLVFCWFLKKKKSDKKIPLLPDEILSSEAVIKNKGYYHDVLEPLFFEVLNAPTTKREKKFNNDPWTLIPFLNGGLFTPHLHDFYDPGSVGTSKYVNTLIVPNEWIKELFEVFETFNFTIDENTTVDVELSIEPEMLGRIFENLLAEINPETGETARKATGSYYTPRAIVDYMVDESIKQYLLGKTNLDKKKVDALLSYEVTEIMLSDSEKEKVIDALDIIKVIDPACGSGAFPMGILQKMLLILQKVDPESQLWLDKKLVNIPDASLRKELKIKLKTDNFNYIHKLGIIRDAIYGVDIQPIATEISKLRFFLSLIVDEAVNDSKENRGIEPLPNLEFKFVCANSLIGLPKNDTQKSFSEATDDIAILKSLRDEYLRSYGSEKKRVQKKFMEMQSKMAKHARSWALWGSEKSQTMKLSQWDPFAEDPCGWFDPEWMFGITDGFDIVIGNPPYGISMSKEYRENILRHLSKVPDYEIYYFFIEIAYKLLKEGGVKAYIIPNTVLFNVFAANYRLRLLENWRLKEILDCTNIVVFEAATVRNIITLFVKENKSTRVGYRNTDQILDFEHLIARPRLELKREQFVSNNQNWGLLFKLSKDVIDLIEKIRNGKQRLIDNFPDISQGLIAYDKYQGQSEKTIKSRQYHYTTNIKRGLKPWLWGEDVSRYHVRWNGKEYIDYCDGIANPREPKYFKGPRALIREITNPSVFAAYTEDESYNDPAIINILPGKSISIKALLAVLNSNLASFYHFNSAPKATKGAFPKILVEDIKNFPLVGLGVKTKNMYDQLDKLSDSIIRGGYNKVTDEHINAIVYELYGLTKDEMVIVEKFRPNL